MKNAILDRLQQKIETLASYESCPLAIKGGCKGCPYDEIDPCIKTMAKDFREFCKRLEGVQ